MYAHSDYKYPMHDGRVLDVEKNGIIIQEKKKEGTTYPNQKSKERNKSCICLMHLRGGKWTVHKL